MDYIKGRPYFQRGITYTVKVIPRQGRLEHCDKLSAAKHLIYGLEGT